MTQPPVARGFWGSVTREVWSLPPGEEDKTEEDKIRINSNNLSSCPLRKNKANNDDQTRFPREEDKFISLKGNLSPSPPQNADDHFPEDSAGNPDEPVEVPA